MPFRDWLTMPSSSLPVELVRLSSAWTGLKTWSGCRSTIKGLEFGRTPWMTCFRYSTKLTVTGWSSRVSAAVWRSSRLLSRFMGEKSRSKANPAGVALSPSCYQQRRGDLAPELLVGEHEAASLVNTGTHRLCRCLPIARPLRQVWCQSTVSAPSWDHAFSVYILVEAIYSWSVPAYSRETGG